MATSKRPRSATHIVDPLMGERWPVVGVMG
jgi:hypothetical protein